MVSICFQLLSVSVDSHLELGLILLTELLGANNTEDQAELSGSAFLLLRGILMELKSPLNIEEQLAELGRHHIQVDDPAKAREISPKSDITGCRDIG